MVRARRCSRSSRRRMAGMSAWCGAGIAADGAVAAARRAAGAHLERASGGACGHLPRRSDRQPDRGAARRRGGACSTFRDGGARLGSPARARCASAALCREPGADRQPRNGAGLAGALCRLGAGTAGRARFRARSRPLRGDRGDRGSRLGLAPHRPGGQPQRRRALVRPAAAVARILPAGLGPRRPPGCGRGFRGAGPDRTFPGGQSRPGLPRGAVPSARGRAVAALRGWPGIGRTG